MGSDVCVCVCFPSGRDLNLGYFCWDAAHGDNLRSRNNEKSSTTVSGLVPRIAYGGLLLNRSYVLLPTYYSAVLIVSSYAALLGKTVNSTWNQSTVGLFVFLLLTGV